MNSLVHKFFGCTFVHAKETCCHQVVLRCCEGPEPPYPALSQPGLAVLLYTFCLLTVCGNSLVIIAVVQVAINLQASEPKNKRCNNVTQERSLHSATNYLIASLAVADSLVGPGTSLASLASLSSLSL